MRAFPNFAFLIVSPARARVQVVCTKLLFLSTPSPPIRPLPIFNDPQVLSSTVLQWWPLLYPPALSFLYKSSYRTYTQKRNKKTISFVLGRGKYFSTLTHTYIIYIYIYIIHVCITNIYKYFCVCVCVSLWMMRFSA